MTNKKVTDLTALTSPADADLIHVIDDVVGTATNKKVLLSDLRKYTSTYYDRTAAEISAGVTPTNYQYEPGNVLRYGDNTTPGTTDMGVVISTWLDVGLQGVPLTGPAEVFLCTTWSGKTITSPIRINAPGMTIKGPGGAADFLTVEDDIEITNCKFDSWNYVFFRADTTSVIVDRIYVDGCEFSNVDYGFGIGCLYSSIIISNNYFNTISNLCISLGTNIEATYQAGQKNVVIDGNVARDISGTAGGNVGFCLVYGKTVTISDNAIHNIDSDTGECWGIYTKSLNTTITGNTIEDMNSNGTNVFAINVKGDARGGVVGTPFGYATVISGNSVTLGNDLATGVACHTNDATITGNYFSECLTGIFVGSSDIAENVSVTSNTIWSTSGGAGTTGISLAGSSLVVSSNIIEGGPNNGIEFRGSGVYSGLVISGNTIGNCTARGLFNNGTADWHDVMISNNIIKDCPTNGMHFLDFHNFSVKDNVIHNVSTNPTLPIQFGATDNSDFHVSGNKIDAAQTTNATVTTVWEVRLPDESAVAFELTVTGKISDSTDRSVHKIAGVFYRDAGGNATQQGSTQAVYSVAATAAWTGPTFAVASANVSCQVTGTAATTIDWDFDLTMRSIN